MKDDKTGRRAAHALITSRAATRTALGTSSPHTGSPIARSPTKPLEPATTFLSRVAAARNRSVSGSWMAVGSSELGEQPAGTLADGRIKA